MLRRLYPPQAMGSMRYAIHTILAGAVVVIVALPASAQIIDTGPGSDGTGCGVCLHEGRFTAIGFTLPDATRITSIESQFVLSDEVVSFGLYRDDGGLPFADLLEWDGVHLPVTPLFGGHVTGAGLGCCS
jgi:hypothetical protein